MTGATAGTGTETATGETATGEAATRVVGQIGRAHV